MKKLSVQFFGVTDEGDPKTLGKVTWDGLAISVEPNQLWLHEVIGEPVLLPGEKGPEKIFSKDDPEKFLKSLKFQYKSAYFSASDASEEEIEPEYHSRALTSGLEVEKKAMSSMGELSGGALVAPPAQPRTIRSPKSLVFDPEGIKRLRKKYRKASQLLENPEESGIVEGKEKSLPQRVAVIMAKVKAITPAAPAVNPGSPVGGGGHPVGVPFQGPSGRWFVKRPSDGMVVPTAAPGAGGGSPSPGGHTPPPAQPLPAAWQTGTPARQKQIANAHAKVVAVLNKLVAGQSLTAQELKAFAQGLPLQHTNIVQTLAQQILAINTTGMARLAVVNQIIAYAQGISGAVPVVPTTPIPAQAAAQQTPPVSPSPASPPPTPTPIAAPPVAPPTSATPPAPAPAAAVVPSTPAPTPTPATPPKKVVTGSNDDRYAVFELVEAELKNLGVDAQTAMTGSMESQILRNLRSQGVVDYSVSASHNIGRALKEIYCLQATSLLPPQWNVIGGVQGPNPVVDDNSRPSNLTLSDQLGIQKYSAGGVFRELNAKLRTTGNPPNNPLMQKMHQELQSAFSKVKPLKTPVQVTRGMSIQKPRDLRSFINQLQNCLSSSNPFVHKGYVSTTTDTQPHTMAWSYNVVMKITATEGLDTKPYNHNPGSNEFLLNDGSQFVVKKVQQVGSEWHVELHQIPSKLPAPPGGWASVASGQAAAKVLQGIKSHPVKTFTSPLASSACAQQVSGVTNHSIFSGRGAGSNDKMLEGILAENGKDKPPQVVDKATLDNLLTQGWTACYRGIDGNGIQTGVQFGNQFRTGALYCGSGYAGNGVYVSRKTASDRDDSNAIQTAKGYSKGGNHTGVILRMAYPPTAKIATGRELSKLRIKYNNTVDTNVANGTMTRSEAATWKDIMSDDGRLATLLNYDAIDGSSAGSGYFVILNRNIIAVEDKDY
jgi:hypothetical protein